MGCQTGFYLLMAATPDVPATIELVAQTFEDISEATEVPAANEVQCGWGASHSLSGAQEAAAAFLAERDEWEQVTP